MEQLKEHRAFQNFSSSVRGNIHFIFYYLTGIISDDTLEVAIGC